MAVYKSFIDIYSPGKFPDHVTPEQFITEARKPIRRNPLITRTLYYSKDMESFATGLKRIHDACREAGVKVEFYGDEYGFTVRFYRHCGEGWGKASDSKTPKRQNDVLDGVLENQILEALRRDPKVTQVKLAEQLNIPYRTLQRKMDEMKLAGRIERIGSKRFGYWHINETKQD